MELESKMGVDEDISDVFATPDFWKASTWLDARSSDTKHTPFFTLDVDSMCYVYTCSR
jgi:hypothetical protein